jgi:hypothetical protein
MQPDVEQNRQQMHPASGNEYVLLVCSICQSGVYVQQFFLNSAAVKLMLCGSAGLGGKSVRMFCLISRSQENSMYMQWVVNRAVRSGLQRVYRVA